MIKNYFNRLFNGNDGAGVGSQLKVIAIRVYLTVLTIDILVIIYILTGRFNMSAGEKFLIIFITTIASGILADVLAVVLYGFGESIETNRKTEKLLELQLDSEKAAEYQEYLKSNSAAFRPLSNQPYTMRPLTPQKNSGESEAERIYKELSEFESASEMYNYVKGAYPTNKALIEALKKCLISDTTRQDALSQAKIVLRK